MRLPSLILISMMVPSAALAAEGKKPPAARRHASTARAAEADAQRVDLFGGYTRLGAGEATLGGWELAASMPLHDSIRLAVDASGASGTFGLADVSQSHLMLGPGWMWSHERLRPFARVLLGAVHGKTEVDTLSDSHTGLGLAAAGGTDYVFSHHWGARAQLGLWFVHGDAGWDTDPHLSIGAVYRFRR